MSKAFCKEKLNQGFLRAYDNDYRCQAEAPKDKGPAIGQPLDEVNPGRQADETAIGAFYRLL